MNKTEKTIKVILKSSSLSSTAGGHVRSRSTPHVRIVTSTAINPSIDKLIDDEPVFSQEANEIYLSHLKKFENLVERRLPSLNERRSDFIFERRRKEPLIFTEKKRVTHQPVPIRKGGSALVITKDTKGDEYLTKDMKASVSKRSKVILKYHTFKWLLDKKKDTLSVLWKNYYVLIKFIRKRGKAITKNDFVELMNGFGLYKERIVVEKIFWVLDNDNNGEIDFRELISGLEFFRDETFEDKMKSKTTFKNILNKNAIVFFEICDADGSGTLSQDEVFDVLKKNVVTKQDKLHLKRIIDLFFSEADLNDNGEIEKNELLKAASTSVELKKVLDDSIKMIRMVDRYTNTNFQEAFQEWLPGGFLVNAKEGIHHPNVSKLVRMLDESEQTWHNAGVLKKTLREEFQKVKNAQGVEVDTEEYGVL